MQMSAMMLILVRRSLARLFISVFGWVVGVVFRAIEVGWSVVYIVSRLG